MKNIESFNVVRDARLKNSNFFVWTGLRQSVPLCSCDQFREYLWFTKKLSAVIIIIIFLKSKNTKNQINGPSWGKKINLEDKELSEAFVMPPRVANEPYLLSLQYKVINSILYTNDFLSTIGYISDPNCSFCHQTTETICHTFLDCSFSTSFGMRRVKINK